MRSFVKGFDKLYLYQLADAQGIIDMRRYDFAIEYYKNKILKEQAESFQKEDMPCEKKTSLMEVEL